MSEGMTVTFQYREIWLAFRNFVGPPFFLITKYNFYFKFWRCIRSSTLGPHARRVSIGSYPTESFKSAEIRGPQDVSRGKDIGFRP